MKVTIFSQSLESISKELVAKLQTRLAHWDVNTTLIGDVLVEMVGNLTCVSVVHVFLNSLCSQFFLP